MNPVLQYLLLSLSCYAVGSINPSYIIGRIRGFDIRERGSGNAGASNAIITMGVWIGIFGILFDFFKAFFCVKAAIWLLGDLAYAPEIAGVCCAIGHIFPFYMRFCGGKGLACIGGMILALDWRVFLIMIGAEVLILALTNFLCMVPITAGIAFPVVWGFVTRDAVSALICAVLGIVILIRHIPNLKKIREGKELKFSYLWNKKKALKEIGVTETDETTENGTDNQDGGEN